MSKGEDTRRTILDRALELSSAVGLEGLSLGKLAEDLGLSKSGLFAHFQSKEDLQIQVLETASERFVEQVVRPGLKAPRGEPRVRRLLERWLEWGEHALPGGCPFMAAAPELDDKPGPVRDRLVALQKDWLDVIAVAVRAAQTETHFRADLDPRQFAQEALGIALGFQFMHRLLRDPQAAARARRSMNLILASARRPGRAASA